MELPTSSIKRPALQRAAFTLAEMLMAMGAGSLILAVVASSSIHSGRALQAMVNYSEMAQDNQLALDQLSQTIRNAEQISSYSSNSRTVVYEGTNMTFTYLPDSKILRRTYKGTNVNVLTGAENLQFHIYQRNVVSNTFNQYLASSSTNAKAVIISWTMRDSVRNQQQTETTHSARIVVRNNP
jgi:hypothetical protein